MTIKILNSRLFLTCLVIFTQGALLVSASAQEDASEFEKDSKGYLVKTLDFNIPGEGTLAIAADNRNIYVVRSGAPQFFKYNLWGSLASPVFSIEGLTGGLTSLTYDGRYFWGANMSNTIYKIDMQLSVPALAGSLTLPFNVTHINFDQSADDENGGFWAGGEDNDIVLLSLSGSELSRISAETHGLVNITGTVVDNINFGNLWVVNATEDQFALLTRLKLPSGEPSGISFNLYREGYVNATDKGGDICIVQRNPPRQTILSVLVQDKKVIGFDLEYLKFYMYDLGVVAIDMPLYITTDENYSITGKIKNFGTETITSYTLNYQINEGEIISHQFTGVNILPLEEYIFTHPVSVVPIPGSCRIKVWASMINGEADENPGNDSKTFDYYVYNVIDTKPRTILLESFTSSSCDPCVIGTFVLNERLEDFEGPYALVKYQMSWPQRDPYYTAEGGVRRTFYSVSGIPALSVNGQSHIHTAFLEDHELTDAQNVPTFVEMKVDYFLDNKTIYAKAEMVSTVDIPATNLRLFLTIVEKITFNNVGNNGETEFKQVMKKFMPDANGILIEGGLKANIPYIAWQKWEFKGEYRLPNLQTVPINHDIEHSVEDFDNLVVISWIQNLDNSNVIQAINAIDSENPIVNFKSLNIDLGDVSASVNGESLLSGEYYNNKETIIFTAHPIDGYEVKEWSINGEILQGIKSKTIEINAEGYIDLTVDFQLNSNINSNLLSDVKIYPNPTTGVLIIENGKLKIENVELYDMTGRSVAIVETGHALSLRNATIDISHLPAGLYFLRIDNQTIKITKK